MREIHDGIYENHNGGWMIAYKLLRQGYYWPTMRQDCNDMVKKYKPCQKNTHLRYQPTSDLIIQSSPIPFDK